MSDDLLSSSVVAYKNAKGDAITSSAADVLTHGAYHRGQIAPIVAVAGGTLAVTDFIVFCREKPAR